MPGLFSCLEVFVAGPGNRMVGAAGFEPATSCSQGRRANQAALRPDPFQKIEDLTYHLWLFGVKEKG
jgi:hypothetical protein